MGPHSYASEKQVHQHAGKKQKKETNWMQRNAEAFAAGSSGILLFLAWLLSHYFSTVSIALYLLSFIIGGYASAKDGLITLLKDKDIDVNLLMIFAAVGAAAIGYWAEGAVLIFIFSLSGALETYTTEKSSRDISALMDLKPETALLYRDGQESLVDIEELQIGDLVIVKPGERIPSDGIIQKGTSSINQASITGESLPVDKTKGDEVFAGTLNEQGALTIEVTKTSESTLFAKIIRLVQDAQSEKPASQRFIEKFERIYARIVVVATIALIFLPHYLFQLSWSDALYKAMVFMVVASPCAVVASIMPAMLSAISNGARKGLLFKGGAHLENIAQASIIAFDKTGTLTSSDLQVTNLVPFHDHSEEELLHYAASIESFSDHPIANAIVQKAKDLGTEIERPDQLESITGWGVQAVFRNQTWKIGKPTFIDEALRFDYFTSVLQELEKEGKTVVVVQNEESVVGVIALQDTIRPHAKDTIAQLKKLGVKVAMLTGDQKITAQAIAEEANIDLVYAELLPEDKVKIVKELQLKYGKVVMVGDGVNDAPALATASVGIAMGGTGSDVALETADLVLMNDDIDHIGTAISLGKRAKRIIQQNLIFAMIVIALLITSNFVEGITLPLGVVGHEGSTILVILNGLRLLR